MHPLVDNFGVNLYVLSRDTMDRTAFASFVEVGLCVRR
jgi:hypothetical protein